MRSKKAIELYAIWRSCQHGLECAIRSYSDSHSALDAIERKLQEPAVFEAFQTYHNNCMSAIIEFVEIANAAWVEYDAEVERELNADGEDDASIR